MCKGLPFYPHHNSQHISIRHNNFHSTFTYTELNLIPSTALNSNFPFIIFAQHYTHSSPKPFKLNHHLWKKIHQKNTYKFTYLLRNIQKINKNRRTKHIFGPNTPSPNRILSTCISEKHKNDHHTSEIRVSTPVISTRNCKI